MENPRCIKALRIFFKKKEPIAFVKIRLNGMESEFLIAPNLSFAYIVFICLVVLVFIFLYNKMFSAVRARMQIFRKLLLLGIGWNFCSLVTVLPNPANLERHLVDIPIILNMAFMLQTLFWLPFGYYTYKTVVLAFLRKPSRFLSYYVGIGIVLYLSVFVLGAIFEPLGFSMEFIGSVSTITAYFLLVIPPLLICAINVLLWGIECWEPQEKNYLMRVASIFFLFGFLALGQDIFLPYVFDGGPNPLVFLKNTQIWASIFLLALYQNLIPKIEFTRLQKISFHVEHIVNDGVITYNEKGKISFVNSAAPLLLHLPEERIKKYLVQEIFGQIKVFEPKYRIPILMIMNNSSRSFQVSVIQDAYWHGGKHYILIFSDVTQENSIQRKFETFKEKVLQQQLLNKQQMLKVYEEGRNKERLLQTLIDNLPFRIAVKNHAGAYVLQNNPDKKVVGDLFGISQKDVDVDDAEKIAQEGKVGHYDRIEYLNNNGEISIAEHFTYLPVPMNDGENYVIRLVRNMTDILKMETERNKFRERESQRSRLEELGSLAGGIAHDFNNILGAQQGFCELAMATVEEDSKTYKYLQEVDKACFRAKTIVGEMLNNVRQLKKTEDKQAKPSTFRLAVLLQDLISQVRSTLPSNIVVVSGTTTANMQLFGLETDLYRVLQNLMNNGAFAMRETNCGELRVFAEEVRLEKPLQEGYSQTISPGTYARIEVSDNGSGIKGSELQRIFSPFFTTKPPGEGYGLGLSSSLYLVRKAHGEITVQSILGKGTTFRVYWPMLENNEGDQNGESVNH